MLTLIGCWITELDDQRLPAPQEFVGHMPAADRARLADYLAAGKVHEAYLGYSWCRFECGIPARQMGTQLLADGTWAWPEGLAHYVREHEVLLPAEFISHALSKGIPLRSGEDSQSPEGDPVDESFWIEWSESRRCQTTRDRLRVGRLAAHELAIIDSATERSEKLAALIAVHGHGPANCMWRGCPHKALAGQYICAEHSVQVSPDPRGRLREELHNILRELTARVGRPLD
jgi:hypothetical protein